MEAPDLTTGKMIGGTWFLKELFSFLLKLRREKTYCPNKEWKRYCTEKFETITERLHHVCIALEVTKVKLSHLEQSIKGDRHAKVPRTHS